MQNRYAADVGDFGKFGMLRLLERQGLRIGVNWYLAGDESHNQDGKHVGYLNDKKFNHCDDELLYQLGQIILSGHRSVKALEDRKLLEDGTYFGELLVPPKQAGSEFRVQWHQRGLSALVSADIVFLDPDNGLLWRDKCRGRKESVKCVCEEEILDDYRRGQSVVFYNHRTHEQLDVYLKRFERLFGHEVLSGAALRGLTFRRGTTRDYFFLLKPEHVALVDAAIEEMMSGVWKEHFAKITMPV